MHTIATILALLWITGLLGKFIKVVYDYYSLRREMKRMEAEIHSRSVSELAIISPYFYGYFSYTIQVSAGCKTPRLEVVHPATQKNAVICQFITNEPYLTLTVL